MRSIKRRLVGVGGELVIVMVVPECEMAFAEILSGDE